MYTLGPAPICWFSARTPRRTEASGNHYASGSGPHHGGMQPREPIDGEPRPEEPVSAEAPAPEEPVPAEAPAPDSTPAAPDSTPAAPPTSYWVTPASWTPEAPVEGVAGEIGWRGIGATVGRTLDTYGSAFPVFVALSIPAAIFTSVTVLAGENVGAALIASLMTALVGLVTSAAMIFTADDLWRGERPSLAGALDRAADRVVPLFLATLVIIAALGGIAALAAIVAIAVIAAEPGAGSGGVLIVAVLLALGFLLVIWHVALRWTLSTPAIVLGGLGPLAGLRQSWSLTRRHLLRLTGLYLVLGLLVVPASIGASLTTTYAAERAVAAVALGVATLLTAPVLAITIAIVYRDLAGRPAPAAAGVERGHGRWTAVTATLGVGLLVLVAGVGFLTSSGGLIYVPDRGQVLAGSSRNLFDPCRPSGVKTQFSSSEEIWIAALFSKRVPAGDQAQIEFFGDGISLGRASLVAQAPGMECYYEESPIIGADPGTYRIIVTHDATVIADGTFTVR